MMFILVLDVISNKLYKANFENWKCIYFHAYRLLSVIHQILQYKFKTLYYLTTQPINHQL